MSTLQINEQVDFLVIETDIVLPGFPESSAPADEEDWFLDPVAGWPRKIPNERPSAHDTPSKYCCSRVQSTVEQSSKISTGSAAGRKIPW